MPALLLYLLKANVALVLFYLAYHLVLRKLTFYHLNRLFLVFGIVFSAVYPLVDLTELFSRHQELAVVQSYAIVIPDWSATAIPEQAPAFDYWAIPVALFWLGCGLLLLRMMVQFVSLYRIHQSSVPASFQGVEFRKVAGISEAFSFWKTIYLNPAQHQSPELESILRHEQIHVNGWHTLDVLLAELNTVFYWFNPGAWLMKKAMKENLEFIADQHVVNAGVDRVAYQYLLLKVVGATQPQLANQFNFPSLKRRIAMMNKMPTKKANRLRLLVVLPLVTVLLVAFRGAPPVTEAIASIESEITKQDANIPDTESLLNQLKQNQAIKSARSKKIDGKDAIVIALKGGGTEVYFVSDAASLAELERKYVRQELPPPPPAPDAPDAPPAPDKSELVANMPAAALYYIDGIKVSREALQKLAPNTIHSMNILKGETAVAGFGKGASKGVISIVTEKNKDSRQVQEFNKKLPVAPVPPAPAAPGTPPPPAPAREAVPPIPPVPPAPAGEQLPPPPPPVRYEGPAIPKAGGARLVETEEHVTYFLWPEETTKRELEAAQLAFSGSGFELNFNETFENGKVSSLKIGLASRNKKSSASATYNAGALRNLREADNIVIVQGNKKTGEVKITTTLAPRYNLYPSKKGGPSKANFTKLSNHGYKTQADTVIGTAALIKKVQHDRQIAGHQATNKFILFLKDNQGRDVDVLAQFNGNTLETVNILATAN